MSTSSNIGGANNKLSVKEMIGELKDWYSYILSKLVILIILSLVGGGIGFLYSMFKQPKYTAVTKFVLEEEDQGNLLGSLGGLASIAGIDIGKESGLFHGENILELYTSRSMITEALCSEADINGKRMLLIDFYIDYNKLRSKWKTIPELKNITFNTPQFSRLQDSLVGGIVKDIKKKNLKVSKSGQSSTLSVEVVSENEFFAKAFNEMIVQKVNDFYIQTKTQKTLEALNILEGKSDSVMSIMNGAIYNAVAIADATPNLNPTRQVQRVAPIQRAQFTAETNKAILSELIKNLEMTKMKLMKETPLIQVIDRPIYPLEKEQIGPIKGVVFGAFIVGFLSLSILILKRMLVKLSSE